MREPLGEKRLVSVDREDGGEYDGLPRQQKQQRSRATKAPRIDPAMAPFADPVSPRWALGEADGELVGVDAILTSTIVVEG